jgi:TolA-binding protein
LLRAERAARRGRCPEALAGFAASLQIPSLAERALYGQASCQQAQGRFSESRRTFEEYLSRYPQGSLATEARRALGSSD